MAKTYKYKHTIYGPTRTYWGQSNFKWLAIRRAWKSANRWKGVK